MYMSNKDLHSAKVLQENYGALLIFINDRLSLIVGLTAAKTNNNVTER